MNTPKKHAEGAFALVKALVNELKAHEQQKTFVVHVADYLPVEFEIFKPGQGWTAAKYSEALHEFARLCKKIGIKVLPTVLRREVFEDVQHFPTTSAFVVTILGGQYSRRVEDEHFGLAPFVVHSSPDNALLPGKIKSYTMVLAD